MLTISGLKKFYFVPHINDMRCGAPRLLKIVKNAHHLKTNNAMEKDQLISMIHFLVKREDERAQENQELKDMVKELRDTHKQDVKTQKNAVPVQDREKDKDDFDGTNGTAMSSTFQADAATVDAETEPAEQSQKSYENRKGLKYQTMNADRREIHESDRNLLPEGATYLWSEYKSSYDQVSYIVQHDYEIIVYKDKNGKMCCGYFPKADEPSVIDCFPGTHASSSLLANLVFNKYHMNTPVYREMVRLLNNRMNMSRNTVYNWFVKGSKHLNKVLPVLKEKLLAKGAVVNCDETLFYHTFIETCKMCGVSTLEYFKEFFNAAIKREQFRIYSRIVEREQLRMISKAIMQGRTDYERSALPLATIGTQEHVTDDHRY